MIVWLLKQNTNGYGIVIGVYATRAAAEQKAETLTRRRPTRRYWVERAKVR